MSYALPVNVTTPGDYMGYIVSVDPNFFNVFLFGLWFILFIGLRASPNLSTAVSWTTASFGSFLLAILLLVGGFIGSSSVIYLVGAVIVGVVLLMREVGG